MHRFDTLSVVSRHDPLASPKVARVFVSVAQHPRLPCQRLVGPNLYVEMKTAS